MSPTLGKSERFQQQNFDYATGKTLESFFLAKSMTFPTWKLLRPCFAIFTRANQGREKSISAILYGNLKPIFGV